MSSDDADKAHVQATPEGAREILHLLRKCRSRLNRMQLHHPATYADISIQLLKQSISTMESDRERGV